MKSKNNPPLVSVVMATYNRAKLLPQAIESILNQTMRHFELIIVDDGSTDETQNIINKYRKQDERIVVIKQHNSGPSAARNEGLKLAQGKYIAMMDDDDVSLPKRFEKQAAFLQQSEINACICKIALLNKDRKIIKEQNVKANKLTQQDINIKDVPCPQLVLNPATMITKKSLSHCKNYRTFFHCAEDYDLTLRFQEHFEAKLLPEILYYRNNADRKNTITGKNFINIMQAHFIAHISAWHRRSHIRDPIDENKSVEEILRLIPALPASFRTHLIVYVKRCIHNIHLYSPDEWNIHNIEIIKNFIKDIQPNIDGKKSKFFIMKLWLMYITFYTKLNKLGI